MEVVKVKRPSFPDVKKNGFIKEHDRVMWQVLCGDTDHWRTGFYSPEAQTISEIDKLEKHSCPEFFILLEGKLTLVLADDKKKEIITIKLQKFKPILIDTWHNGFCPNGAYTGKALVVERDNFVTEYRATKDFVDNALDL